MSARIFLHIIILLMFCIPVAGFAAPVTTSITPGLNLTGVTAALVTGQQTAFPLLTLWKPSGVTAIESYDVINGKMLRTELDGAGNPVGADFPLIENSALYVYSTQQNTFSLGNSTSCAPLNLVAGLNLVSHACFPPNFTVSQFIASVGIANITSLSRLDLQSGRWQTAAVDNGAIVGDDFPLTPGEGYIIQSATVTSGWLSPIISLAPASMTVWQGEPGAALTVTIPGPAPVGGTLIDLVSSDPTLVGVAPQVTVTQGSSSVSIPLTLPDTGSSSIQPVTVTASRSGTTSAHANLSVHPKPTINLSPLTTLTGLTFTYLLTANLSDIAPPGGFPVTLTAVPANIVSVPASVIIPAGASFAQVTVSATAVGSATITATSPGRGVSGAQNAVTVTPIQTMNYGPVSTALVGVTVTIPSSAGSQNVPYGPVVSGQVGIVVGSAMTGVLPPTGPIGTTGMKVTVAGISLSTATAIAFEPATGITIQPGSFTINGDGNPEVTIDIDPTAPTIMRAVIVSLPAGVATVAAPGVNQFRVTMPEPQILGMQPIRSMTGQMFSLNIFGKNLAQASSINFTPATGISVSNPPTINAAGDMATVTVSINTNAPLGDRVVTITTPGWNSSALPSVANTFSVTADSGTTYTPIISSEVGVMVLMPTPSNSLNMNYGPIVSGQVGVVVGSAVSGIIPPTGATGTVGLKVTVTGSALASATAIAFQPATGINIQSFTINGDGNPEVNIDIDAAAPTITRTVIVTLPSGVANPAAPGANQFRVTLPEPQILGMQPIRAMIGQNVSLNVFGRNFTSAISLDFTQAAGVSVNNPPTINAAGDMATVTVNIAANAPLGDRVVTITTPGWTSSAKPSAANTFSVTADAGTTYTPFISSEVGIMVAPASGSNQVNMNYGPISSTEVGVMVPPVATPTTQNVNYGPIVSTQVGVAIGGALTGVAPLSVEPGRTTTLTLTGAGLNQATAIQIIPSTGITVGTWTAALDGLSGTVVITADATTPIGQKSLVVLTSGGSIKPSAPGASILLAGYKPIVNSVSPILPTVGNTLTLTINGVYLQGATKIEILPSDNVDIDSPPVWSSDGTGEHLTVKVIIDSAAAPGDRVVIVTTPYGVTTVVGSPANTITFFKPGALLIPQSDEERIVVSHAELFHNEPAEVLPKYKVQVATLSCQRERPVTSGVAVMAKLSPEKMPTTACETSQETTDNSKSYLYSGYRGPPGFPAIQKSNIPGGLYEKIT